MKFVILADRTELRRDWIGVILPALVEICEHRRSVADDEAQESHDVMRHTFISLFAGKFRSMGDAALQAGNGRGGVAARLR
jgi:hypothetical protein